VLAEDIILPEVGKKPPQTQEPVYAVLTSDTHIGHKIQQRSLQTIYPLAGRQIQQPQMREIAGRVKYLLIAGDIVDIGIYLGSNMNSPSETSINSMTMRLNIWRKFPITLRLLFPQATMMPLANATTLYP
jgi:DNA polymerase II small subunit/DNA polymerase delta subunit B